MKTTFIFNLAPKYNRDLIFNLDQIPFSKFIIGDIYKGVKSINTDALKSKTCIVKNLWLFKEFYIQLIPIKMIPKQGKVVMTGDFYCITNWILLLFFKLKKIEVHLWTHGLYGNEGVIKFFLKKFFYNLSDGLFLYSERAFKLMSSKGYNQNKMLVVYNSINSPITKVLTKVKLFDNDLPVVFYLGRITPTKKMNSLLESFYEINKEEKKINLFIIGDVIDNSINLNSVKNGPLASNFLHKSGIYDELELASYFSSVDLAVVPGDIGLFLLHCLTYNLPVVTHDNIPLHGPEIELLEDGINGLFYKYNDQNSLNNTIIKCLSMKFESKGKNFKKYNAKNQYKIIKNFLNKTN